MEFVIATSTLFQTTTQTDSESLLEKSAEISGNIQDVTNFAISIVWLVIYIYSFHHCEKPIYTSIKIITILYPAGYALKYLLDIFIIFVIDAHYPNNKDAIWTNNFILDPIQKLCFVITNTSFYLSILLKVHSAFGNSVFALKKNKLYVLSTLLVLALLIDVTYFTTRKIVREDLSDKIDPNVPWHLNWIRTLYLWILGCTFIAFFVQKLLQLVMLQSRSRTMDSCSSIEMMAISPRSDVIKEEKKNLSRKQKELLQIAVKFMLLHGIAITLILAQFSGWTLLHFELIKNETSVLWFGVCWSWFWDIVLCINLSLIWLSFAFAKSHYTRVCHTCDQCCLKICSSMVAVRMADEIEVQRMSSLNLRIETSEGDITWHE